jgi:hypothetical protein
MKAVSLSLATLLLAGTAVAQTPGTTTAPPGATTSRDHNPSVATTSNANDAVYPAKGSNSFSESQAKSHIADRGYTNVAALQKDNDGVWHGTAQRNGQPVQVWLDYKGNVGETH